MQEGFLADLKSLGPDLCVTAAYGNYLPSRFLAIPPCGNLSLLFSAVHYFTTTFFSIALASFLIVMNLDLSLVFRTSSNLIFFICVQMCGVAGTVNVHPSLLPLYRGAAPVQRALLVKML